MIKNFDEVKKQLAELSGVVNKFQSEAVQLKIVELIFAGAGNSAEPGVVDPSPIQRGRGARKKRNASPAPAVAAENGRKRATPKAKGTGPSGTLDQFIQDGFFNQKRMIGAIVEHCQTNARNFKANELSGPLAARG
jgi:hypothetical protein